MSKARDLSNPDLVAGVIKSATIVAPTSTDSFTLFWSNSALTLAEIRSVVSGTSPSTTFTIYTGNDRSGASNTVIQSGIVCTNTTSGNVQTSFSNNTVQANSFVWITVTAVSGTVNDINVSLRF